MDGSEGHSIARHSVARSISINLLASLLPALFRYLSDQGRTIRCKCDSALSPSNNATAEIQRSQLWGLVDLGGHYNAPGQCD